VDVGGTLETDVRRHNTKAANGRVMSNGIRKHVNRTNQRRRYNESREASCYGNEHHKNIASLMQCK
jgi:hypothetical protein